jgi:hypothetical protein
LKERQWQTLHKMSFFSKIGDSINKAVEKATDKLAAFSTGSKEVVVGPFLKFIGTDLEENVNRYSIMIVTGRIAYVPNINLSEGYVEHGPVKLDEYHHHQFYRYDIVVPLKGYDYVLNYKFTEETSYDVHIPASDTHYNIIFFSCNGLSCDVTPQRAQELNGIQPLWRDVIRKHQKEPFHAMIGGGDQIYCDTILEIPSLESWLSLNTRADKLKAEFTSEMNEQSHRYYFDTYFKHFGEEGFAQALATIPYNFVWDDHDIFDGYGSFPAELQMSPVFNGIYAAALRFCTWLLTQTCYSSIIQLQQKSKTTSMIAILVIIALPACASMEKNWQFWLLTFDLNELCIKSSPLKIGMSFMGKWKDFPVLQSIW